MNTRSTATELNPEMFKPTPTDVQRAQGDLELRNLRSISLVLAVFFALLGTAYLILFPSTIGAPLFVMALLIAAGFVGVSEYVRRARVSTRRLILVNGLVALAAAVGALVSMYVIGLPVQVIGACLLVVGLGVFVMSLRWYVAVMGLTVMGWAWLVWRQGMTPEWLTTLLLLGGAVVLSVSIYILRQRFFHDLERTRLRQQEQQEELERTLREQERIQNELGETETRFRTLMEQLPAATFVDALDPNATTLYVSPQIETITGYTAAEWMAEGTLWEKLLYSQDAAGAKEALRKHQETGERFVFEYRLVRRDGQIIWIHDEAVIVKDARGVPIYSQGYMTDITERKEVEDALRRRDAIYETVRYAAETFLRASSWEDRIERVLARLGTATQVSRVVLAENQTENDKGRRIATVHEWHTASSAAPMESSSMILDLPGMGPERWDAALSLGIPVYGNASDFPAEERGLLAEHRVQSCAIVPVFVGREWWGMIGFEVEDRPYTWTSMELDALQAAANTLGAAIQRNRDEREVAAARDLALEASRLKSEFLAMMSHEIRTPMNSIVGMSELLLESPLTPEQHEYASSVRHASDVLLTIINDILDFSKFEAGRFTLEPVAFDLGDLIAGTVDLLVPTAREKGLDLKVKVGNYVPLQLIGDAGRLRQVLINLLSNAIKFTEKGNVTLDVKLDKVLPDVGRVQVAFAVSDTGIGIAPDTLARLFQPFMQGDMSITRRYGGTGLGLAISRRLVELMGGKIGVESVEGEGSVFTFSIPMQTQQALGAELKTSLEPLSPERLQGLVLVAEDSAANLKLAQLQLQLLGVREVETAASGRAVVHAIRNAEGRGVKYALVLMDCQMPEQDGYEAARAIRQLEAGTGDHVPIVAITASALEGDKEACLAAGMDDYITKPVRLDALRAALDRWLPREAEDKTPRMFSLPAQRAAAASTVSMDFHTLDILRSLETADTRNGTRELVESYLEETATRIQVLGDALSRQEPEEAQRIAHSIRGSSVSLGAVRLAELAKEIEQYARERETDLANQMLPGMHQEFERVRAVLQAEAFVSPEAVTK